MGRGSKRATHDLPATSILYEQLVIFDKFPMKWVFSWLSHHVRQNSEQYAQ